MNPLLRKIAKQPATATSLLPPLKFTQPSDRKLDDYELVWVDTQKLDREWSKDKHLYLAPGDKTNHIGDRYARFTKWRQDNPDTPVEAPIVSWSDNAGGEAHFTNGRHRFSVLRDQGYPKVQIMVPKSQISTFSKLASSSVREISISEDQGSAEGYTADTNAEQLQNWLDRFGYTNEEFVADLRKKYDSFAVLNNINVYEDSRGKGYGDYLLQEFLREAGDRGAGICLLVADTAEEQAKGFNLVEWYERNDFEQIASVYGGELMILGILNPKIAAKKAAADIGQMKNIVAEMMGVLTAGLPQPEVKIINQTNRTLGQCR